MFRCYSGHVNDKLCKNRWPRAAWWLSFFLAFGSIPQCAAQTPEPTNDTKAAASADNDELARRCNQLEQHLTGSVFIGHFIDTSAKPDDNGEQKSLALEGERYEITSAKRMQDGDMWLIQSRIKYGDHDMTIPIPLPIKWAGKTPVITLDQLAIPGLGTFDAKVVISGDRYAGTWQHGKHGGHLFGRIESMDATSTGSNSAK